MMNGYGSAAMDLGMQGMGDSLPQQLADSDEERRKKMKQPAGMQGTQYTMTGGGLAAMDLGLR